MIETIKLDSPWGISPFEAGAFDGLSRTLSRALATQIAQAKWTRGEPPLITRADVDAAK